MDKVPVWLASGSVYLLGMGPRRGLSGCVSISDIVYNGHPWLFDDGSTSLSVLHNNVSVNSLAESELARTVRLCKWRALRSCDSRRLWPNFSRSATR